MYQLTERILANKARALQIVANALDAGVIYNVEFNEAKDDLNRAFEAEVHTTLYARIEALGQKPYDVLYMTEGLDVSCSWYIHAIPGIFKKAEKKAAQSSRYQAAFAAVVEFLRPWNEIAANLAALKPLVVKGRKPSAEPRKTKERTLENTGTCPICGQNVKLDGDGMYHHGFTLQWGQRSGSCFGTGRKPWEVSPEGAVEFVAELRKIETERLARRAEVAAGTATLMYAKNRREMATVEPGAPEYARRQEIALHELDSEIRQLVYTIVLFDRKIAAWEAQPLPTA